jgi:hypothetical protein
MNSMQTPGGADKAQRYILGQEIFSKVYNDGTYPVDSLFEDPRWTDTLFGKSLPAPASKS